MKKQRTVSHVLRKAGISTSLADAGIIFVAIAMLGNGRAEAQHPPADTQVECASQAARVKAVTSPGDHTTDVEVNLPPRFGNVPLLTTEVTVEGPGASCLIAHFSAEVQPRDNGIFFQVRVDGVPMEGHFANPAAPSTPVVFETSFSSISTSDPNVRVMLSYNFFSRVTPGVHTVDILFAGCCSAVQTPGISVATVGSPVLTLEHR